MRFPFTRRPEKLSVTVKHQSLPVTVKRNTRAKRLILRVDAATGAPVLTLPRRTSLHEAQLFVDRNSGWIERRLQGIQPSSSFADGLLFPLRGRDCRIVAHGGRGLARHFAGDDCDELHIPGAPEHVARRAGEWLKREARRDLEAAVDHYAAKLGRSPAALRIGDARTRWGSCTAGGRLTFSWRLILAPPSVLSYVAAHEVAHLEEMNHSRRFWAVVRRLDPKYAAARAWLKANGATLHAVGRATPTVTD